MRREVPHTLIITTWLTGAGVHTHSIEFDDKAAAQAASDRHANSIESLKCKGITAPGYAFCVAPTQTTNEKKI